MVSARRWVSIQLLLTLAFTGMVTVAVCLAYHYNHFSFLDNFLYDYNIKWRGFQPTSGKVVLVLMDEKSAVELERRKGSWSRKQMAQALTNMCRAGAEIVGMDIAFAAPDMDPRADQMLAQAIGRCNNVVLAKVLSGHGVEILPLDLFQEQMIGDGFIDVPLDEDEVLRRIRFLNAKPLANGSLQLLPAFSLELVRTFLNIEFMFDFSGDDFFIMGAPGKKQLRLPYPELRINFTGDYSAFLPRLSYADVVHNRFLETDVKGKIVLIGSSLAIEKDFFTTPFSKFQRPSEIHQTKFRSVEKDVLGTKELGVACQAWAVETILANQFISKLSERSYPAMLALIVVMGLAGLTFYIPALNLIWQTLIMAAGGAVVVALGYLFFLKKLLWIETAPLLTLLLLQFVVGIALQRIFAKRKTAQVTEIFGKYLSAHVVDELIKGDLTTTLEGRDQELTLLFADLRSFTSLSERLGAKDTSHLLNHYFESMISIISAHEGIPDKIMGDAVMALFGAPVYFADHPVKAAEAALDMLKGIDELKRSHTIPGLQDLAAGIGLNTGTVIVGNLGSQKFMNYTAIGDAVNLASRLESLNKVYGTHIIISEFTASRLDDRFLLRELDRVQVKGQDRAVAIYELMSLKDMADGCQHEMIRHFKAGLAAFRNRWWNESVAHFERVLQKAPEDGPAKLFLDRIEKLKKMPADPLWDGVMRFESK
jgi:adenylate cyclase